MVFLEAFRLLNKLYIALAAVCIFFIFYLFSESSFISSVLEGEMEVGLFLQLLPHLFSDYLFSSWALFIHHVGSAFGLGLLLNVYATLYIKFKILSFRSISTSLLGLLGISLGTVCLACSAFGIYALFSLTLASVALPLAATSGTELLIVGDLLLLVSIIIGLWSLGSESNNRKPVGP